MSKDVLFLSLRTDNLKRPFINVASTSQGATCTETSADPSHKCADALDDNINTEYRVNSNDNSANSSISITFDNEYLINAVKITQRQDASIQILEVKVSFGDGKGLDEYVRNMIYYLLFCSVFLMANSKIA